MLHLSSSYSYYLHRPATGMRKGFDSLCGIVTSGLQMDALSGSVFIFINKKRNQLKLLLWEGGPLLQLRQKEAAPVLKELEQWTIEEYPKVTPSGVIGKAISYCLRRWKKFRTPYLSQSDSAVVLKMIVKSVPGKIVSV